MTKDQEETTQRRLRQEWPLKASQGKKDNRKLLFETCDSFLYISPYSSLFLY